MMCSMMVCDDDGHVMVVKTPWQYDGDYHDDYQHDDADGENSI